MELIDNKQIYFEPLSHTYIGPNDKILSGLTSLMEKHSLSADYSKIPESVLNAAAEKGTAIHKLLQDYDEGNSLLNEPLIEEYRNAIHNAALTHIASEYLVSDNQIVATFIDKVYDTGIPNVVDLADVKTTQKVHNRALAWQLGAGAVLFERQNPGIKVRNVFCIHIDKGTRKLKGLYPVEPVTTEEVDALLDAERKGLIYIDEYEVPSLDVALGENALTYAEGLGKIDRLKAELKKLEDGLKSYDAEIISYMEEHNLTSIDTPEGKITKRAASSSERVDTDKLKSKFPHIWELVKKTSHTKASLTFKPKE